MGDTIHLQCLDTGPSESQWQALDALGVIYDGDDGAEWGERPTTSLHLQWQSEHATRRDALTVAGAVAALGLTVGAVTITDTDIWADRQRVIRHLCATCNGTGYTSPTPNVLDGLHLCATCNGTGYTSRRVRGA